MGLYAGIKRILENQSKQKAKPKHEAASPREQKIAREQKHILKCGRILRVEVERKLVVITVTKADGEIHTIRIEANQD